VHLVLRLPTDVDDVEVAAAARNNAVHVEPLSSFSLTGRASGALVLGYGRVPERNIHAAVAALADVVRSARPPAPGSAAGAPGSTRRSTPG
jgi:DNA-binding transcriptional MocR family regulator